MARVVHLPLVAHLAPAQLQHTHHPRIKRLRRVHLAHVIVVRRRLQRIWLRWLWLWIAQNRHLLLELLRLRHRHWGLPSRQHAGILLLFHVLHLQLQKLNRLR